MLKYSIYIWTSGSKYFWTGGYPVKVDMFELMVLQIYRYVYTDGSPDI